MRVGVREKYLKIKAFSQGNILKNTLKIQKNLLKNA